MRESNMDITKLTFDVNAKFLRDTQQLFFKAAIIDYKIVDAPPHIVEASRHYKDAVLYLTRILPEVRSLWKDAGWIEDPSSSYGKLPMTDLTLLLILCALSRTDYPGITSETWSYIHEVVL